MGKKIIKNLIEEGKKIQEEDNFENFKGWKRKVQFNMERIGTPSMISEIEKEMNKKPLWIATPSMPKHVLDEQFKVSYRAQLKNLIGILNAISEIKIKKKVIPKKIKKESFFDAFGFKRK